MAALHLHLQHCPVGSMLHLGGIRRKRGWLEKYQEDKETTKNGFTTTTEQDVSEGQHTRNGHLPVIPKSTKPTPGGEHAIAGGDMKGSSKVAAHGQSSSSSTLFIILAVVVAVVVILIVAAVVYVFMMKKRKAKKRLHAALDEEERLRQERVRRECNC
ncbi:hypothetical protein Y032_0252g202 [Ancylostoma ceylanicum]|uniref:Uncharacterized protein n=2 Tax=Ancylostoma ceylanicum TaxID=53326 RepID=A0A016SCI8_9BILA|nr:hypothetical protein Y032_0252g202 [Ancylostoma ceylanicum]